MNKPIIALALIMALGLGAFAAGCASSSRTSRSEEVTYETPPVATTPPAAGETKTVQTESETKTEAAHPVGIIGTTWHLLGEILAFPFLLVGNALRLIF
jgi:hypothetical protein